MEKKWKEMSAKEKREARFNTWLSAPGVQFQNREAEASYKAAIMRFKDAVLRERTPDRVPVFPFGTFFQGHLYGVTPHESMYDYEKLTTAHKKFLQDYQPDYYATPAFIGSGKILETLGYKLYKWPGHGIPKESGYQFVEGEYMFAEDYPALIEDPTDFWLRTYLPRVFGALEPLTQVAPFTNLWEIVGVSGQMISFGIPPVQQALKALMEVGNEAMAWNQQMGAYELEVRGMGFPTIVGGATKAPFDIISDTLRGIRGMMMDMYRQPEMVVKALERITPLYIKQGVGMATFSGIPVVFMPLHKGADGFMSDEQYRKFYWPSFKAVLLGLIDEGIVPFMLCEGGYNTRLQYLAELPKGSCFCMFDRTDMASAKKVLGETLCIGGNVPAGLVLTGTAEDVRTYCRNLIDVAGKGGGFILGMGTSMDEAKADTLHAMIDTAKEYGVYRQ